MKTAVIIAILALLTGCATLGSDKGKDDSGMAELFQDVTDINCIAAFSLGKRLGDVTTVREAEVQAELRKYIDLSDPKQKECYKGGLVYNRVGGGITVKAIKTAIAAVK